MEYLDFLKQKQFVDFPSGIEKDIEINSILFPFQRDIVRWGLRRGRAAVFAGCGLGKTFIQLEWAKHIPKKVLILAPLAVAKQTIREGKKIGVEVKYCRNQEQVNSKITITNYEMLERFNAPEFNGVVLDECFPPDAKIDVFNIDNSLGLKYIKDINIGDKIINASGEDYVHQIYKRKINRAVQINIDKKKITCSENHPFFTLYGWKCAQDIQSGDYIMATEEAVRLVWNEVQPKICRTENAEILREILFSEMENEHSRICCESTQSGSSGEERPFEVKMAQKWKFKSNKGNRENNKSQSNEQSRNKSKGFIGIATDEAQTFRAWGEWPSDDISSAVNEGCLVRELDTGISHIVGKTSTRFSNMLQGRLGESRLKNSNRNRRSLSSQQERIRQKEGYKAGFARVESIEILEQGHPELEKYRDAEGNIYFYDIKATRHPSFSVNGLVVHNSSILKSFTGSTRNLIIESFAKTPFKLACTATPAPNDYMELGNHSEFLGVMPRSEMLSMFFVHDGGETSKWRLKGHAEKDYWKWLASWAVMMQKPSDLRYEDDGFILPSLNYHEHIVEGNNGKFSLFDVDAKTLLERRQARRESLNGRVKLCAELVNQSNDIWLIWCNLNAEGNLLKKLIKDSVQVEGADSLEFKENNMLAFSDNKIKCLITKPSIAGHGMNWQNAHNMAFVGLSDSWEEYYQAVRREWRFGQKSPVNVHVIISKREGAVLKNIKRKEQDAEQMLQNMVIHMHKINEKILHKTKRQVGKYNPQIEMELPLFLKGQNN